MVTMCYNGLNKRDVHDVAAVGSFLTSRHGDGQSSDTHLKQHQRHQNQKSSTMTFLRQMKVEMSLDEKEKVCMKYPGRRCDKQLYLLKVTNFAVFTCYLKICLLHVLGLPFHAIIKFGKLFGSQKSSSMSRLAKSSSYSQSSSSSPLRFILLTLCILSVTGMASSIRLMSVSIPPHAIRGQDVKLECLYDMEGDKLYSIKWYRNGHEFYRYIPTDRPSTAIFDGNGIKVDRRQSTQTSIMLKNVGLDTTGKFRCEISGEAPLFQTAYKDAVMAVVDLPDEGPIITGGFPRYHIGDKVQINCTSHKSKPAAKLRWYINGEQADKQNVKRYRIEKDEHGLETSTLGLRFKVKEKHFRSSGDLKLKCTATIATIYWKSNEESVQGVQSQSALVSESRSSRNSATNSDTDYTSSINVNNNINHQNYPRYDDILFHNTAASTTNVNCVFLHVSKTLTMFTIIHIIHSVFVSFKI